MTEVWKPLYFAIRKNLLLSARDSNKIAICMIDISPFKVVRQGPTQRDKKMLFFDERR